MSVWRHNAIECAPELKNEFQATDLTPYTVFMELIPIVIQAHLDHDNNKLSKIYAFAEWCHGQRDQKLWNAADVSFYEHLLDHEETSKQFTNWIKKDIYFDIRDLLMQNKPNEKQIGRLDEYYGFKNKY